MGLLRGTVLSAISALFLATAAPAQEGEGSLDVPSSLYAGAEITISYSNPEQAGLVIAVQASDGSGEGDVILIELDEDGEGYGLWEVSDEWEFAHFSAPGAQMESRWISLPN